MCVKAGVIYQPTDKISIKNFQWLQRVVSIFDLSKYKITWYQDIQYSPFSFTLALRDVHLQNNQKSSVRKFSKAHAQ